MAWYLQHYFDPDKDHLQLKPADADDGSDLYNLGYVQNVVAGQVLAEIVPLESVSNAEPRFVQDSPYLPVGPNTRIDPAHPHYLLAATKGYVFYLNERITVKKMLNVRSDVCFQTGNIFFVGDVAVHGDVRAGFEVQAANVLIKGMVEGGSIRAQHNLAIMGGARGGAGDRCVLDVGGTLRSPFVEKLEIRARDNIFIEKYCLHSNVYAGAHMVVNGRLAGGTINAYGSVMVKEQLGNMAAVPTRIYMGYDPLRIRQLEKGDQRIANLSETITHLTAVAGHLPPETNETTRKLQFCLETRDRLIQRRAMLWKELYLDEQTATRCKLLVPGKVYPGVEIAIGRIFLTVERPCENVTFAVVDQELHCMQGTKV